MTIGVVDFFLYMVMSVSLCFETGREVFKQICGNSVSRWALLSQKNTDLAYSITIFNKDLSFVIRWRKWREQCKKWMYKNRLHKTKVFTFPAFLCFQWIPTWRCAWWSRTRWWRRRSRRWPRRPPAPPSMSPSPSSCPWPASTPPASACPPCNTSVDTRVGRRTRTPTLFCILGVHTSVNPTVQISISFSFSLSLCK